MKLKRVQLAPALIAVCVIVLVGVIRLLKWEAVERFERFSHDLRVRAALHFPKPAATNLGIVLITDQSISAVNQGLVNRKPYGLYWPRHVYARMLRELSLDSAKAVGFDVLFAEPRTDHAAVSLSVARWPDAANFLEHIRPRASLTIYRDGPEDYLLMESDDFFAWQLNRAGMAILAAEQGVSPCSLFATNALGLGDISADPDPDGVLRLALAFRIYTNWHGLFRKLEADKDYGADLGNASAYTDKVVLHREGAEPIEIPLDAEGTFALADFIGDDLNGQPPRARPYTTRRVWHMGIVLAAQELGLDLENADVELEAGRIVFPKLGGGELILPVDGSGYFPINWELTLNDPRIHAEPIEDLLQRDQDRVNDLPVSTKTTRWQNRLVIVGSSTTGNDLTDWGATSLAKRSLLVSKHLNVVNSFLTGRFVKKSSLGVDLLVIALLGGLSAWMTWQFKGYSAFGGVVVLTLVYGLGCFWAYIQHRYWLPLVLPIAGALLAEHVMLATYRLVFAEKDRRRVKSIFSKMLAPKVVHELLEAEQLSLGGARRQVTMLFADVRGFTELTDLMQEEAIAYVEQHNLHGTAAESCFEEAAKATLETVNLYLATVAEKVIAHDGTLDKYIGDCVMAYWGAPTPALRPAAACVRAAIDAQRAIHNLNQWRELESRERESENLALRSAGLPPKPRVAILTLGTGINTGQVTAGIMGSDAYGLTYTVFGREVNLASRLEHESGSGRIIISETTHKALHQEDPELARTCVQLPPVIVKGIRHAVTIYEVPWREANSPGATATEASRGSNIEQLPS